MGRWGARGLEVEPHHQDPAYVLWATLKLVDAAKLPDQTVVVRFELRDRPGDNYWLLLRRPAPELCTRGTGYVEDIIARTDAAFTTWIRPSPYADIVPARPPARPPGAAGTGSSPG